jgi:hypothetical protein
VITILVRLQQVPALWMVQLKVMVSPIAAVTSSSHLLFDVSQICLVTFIVGLGSTLTVALSVP